MYRRITIYLLLLLAVFITPAFIQPPLRPASQAISGTESPSDSTGTATPAVTLSPLIDAELNYYFSLHNVQDEGYEMVAAFANGQRHAISINRYVPIWNVGVWQHHDREGTAVSTDSLGLPLVGTWHEDTLETAIRPDTLGTYVGDFSDLKAFGHGAYYATDNSYYEGHWEHGQRQGFGLQMQEPLGREPRLQVGEWLRGRFMGERMRYTSERIYGIDIARYQHGKGRKKFPINWQQMRITHVGKRGSQNVSSSADYPVSFLYIKSTEGTTIRNQYYRGDYQQAHRHSISTGAYHFFSVRSDGASQARFFLKHTLFSSGDLPPVLDVEPSDAQIRQMGGQELLFRHIRTWLNIVEQQVGVRPILYVNQRFVNLYLPDDLKRNYRIWIARYSEYKPDVKLTYWQLSADGHVAGIRGDVDINVFNGYRNQFEDFLEQETIK